ncbi:hypothetical protein BS78_K078900 [Paspalum vaginatum]|uniref:Myb/SANT-like domain-containing protein n=1 Tax=Paspalum vaginatum TaxID=158149 RepID=A0A9W7XA04_9POAL|nr:hypothetical protein BS78_K078900 [Paspalum vaginatum]
MAGNGDEVPILGGQVDGEAEQVQEVQEGPGRTHWTPAMSGFVLKRFVELVVEGVKTDKGFKDCHLNSVARDLTKFLNNGRAFNGNHVYNHLRKCRARWVKVYNLKQLSGALWDEDNFMITLEAEHFKGHVKVHPKDVECLNAPIINYMPMQIIFGSGVAIGRYAVGSNEPLGTPSQPETIDLDLPEGGMEPTDTPPSYEVSDGKKKGEGSSQGKRKRVFSEDDHVVMNSMTEAIWGFATAVKEAANSEAAPGVYDVVMGCTAFTREARMHALDHLTVNKATGLVFVQMTPKDKDLWMRTHLAKTYYNV